MNWLKVRHTEVGYGFFPGGDPRKFYPDSEGQTPEEAENHHKACEAWDNGLRESEPDGKQIPGVGFVDRCQFGLGSYEWDEELWFWEWVQWEWWPRLRNRVKWRLSWWWHARKRS